MLLRVARFIGLLFLALALGIGFSTLVGGGARPDLSGTSFLKMQQVLYQDIGRIMGLVEPIALVAVLLSLLSVFRRKPFFIMTLISLICIAVMIGMRILVIQPLHLEITSWSAEDIPGTWMFTRNRYYLFTAVRVALAIIGFCSFTLSVLFDTHPYRVLNKGSQ